MPWDQDGNTSVFQIRGLSASRIWSLLLRHATRPLLARADILVSVVGDVGLKLDPDNRPLRHASITGWPEAKSAKMVLAKKIAAEATLFVPPRGP